MKNRINVERHPVCTPGRLFVGPAGVIDSYLALRGSTFAADVRDDDSPEQLRNQLEGTARFCEHDHDFVNQVLTLFFLYMHVGPVRG